MKIKVSSSFPITSINKFLLILLCIFIKIFFFIFLISKKFILFIDIFFSKEYDIFLILIFYNFLYWISIFNYICIFLIFKFFCWYEIFLKKIIVYFLKMLILLLEYILYGYLISEHFNNIFDLDIFIIKILFFFQLFYFLYLY